MEVGTAEALAESLADVPQNGQPDLWMLIQQIIKLSCRDFEEGGIAITNDGGRSLGPLEQGQFAEDGTGLESGDGIAMDGGHADLALKQDVNVLRRVVFCDDFLEINRMKLFSDLHDRLNLLIGEAIGEVAIANTREEIHGFKCLRYPVRLSVPGMLSRGLLILRLGDDRVDFLDGEAESGGAAGVRHGSQHFGD